MNYWRIYLEDLIEQVSDENSEEVLQAIKEAQEILQSDLFIEQKGIRSLVDKDARVGCKSKTQSFYGYKAELCQTTDGGLITSIIVEPGNYVDGCHFKDHLEEIQQSGLTVTGVFGDKAYRTQKCRVKKIPWIEPGQWLRLAKCPHSGKTNRPGSKFKADSQAGIRLKRSIPTCFYVVILYVLEQSTISE